MLLPDFPRKKLLTKSFRTTILSTILLCLPIGGHAVKPPACSSIEDPRIKYLVDGVAAFCVVINSLHLSVQTAARNLMNVLWPDQPSGTETEAAATGTSQEPDTVTREREEAISWVAEQLGNEEPTNAVAWIPSWLARMMGSDGEDTTDAASGTGLTSPREALNNVVNRRLDAFQLANVVNESIPGHQALVRQILAETQALPLVTGDQTDNVPASAAEDTDSDLGLRTQPTDNLQLSQLTTLEGFQTVLSNTSDYGVQNVLIALHGFLLKEYLKLRDSGDLSEPLTNEYRRSISHLVMATHTISQYSQSETSAQREQDGLNNWITNRYVSEVFDRFSQSVGNPDRPFTADHLNDGIRMAFGIIQYFRSSIIARRVGEQAEASAPESEAELDRDAGTVDTVGRLDSLANLLVQDSNTPLSSLAYARNNVFPHTNAILTNSFWLRGNITCRGLNNLQRWHILNEMHVALQLVVLGQNELALSLLSELNDTYKLQETDEHNPLPSASNASHESIIRWVFGMVDTILDFSDESEPTPETSGNVLRDRFFISVYALVIYTETPNYAQGRSDHQIIRINDDVLDYLYKLLLTPKDRTETEASSENEPVSGATSYLDSRYANFLRDRHENHKRVLKGKIQPEASGRLKERLSGQ